MSHATAAPVLAVDAEVHNAVITADIALTPYLDGQTYDEARVVAELKSHYAHHASSAFEVGKRLVILKEKTAHGRFREIVQGELHVSTRYATHLMSFARLAIDVIAHAKGAIDENKLARMSSTKLLLLGEIIPEYADELTESGTLAGRPLDEYDTLTRDQLRQAIIDLKDDKQKGRETVANWKQKAHDAHSEIDKLTAARDANVFDQCNRLRKTFSAAANLFQNCLPKLDKPEASSLAEIFATKQFILAQAGGLIEYIDALYPGATETAAHADNHLAMSQAMEVLKAEQKGGNKPRRKDKPDTDPTTDIFTGLADDDEFPGQATSITYAKVKEVATLHINRVHEIEIAQATELHVEVVQNLISSAEFAELTSGIQTLTPAPASVIDAAAPQSAVEEQ